MVALISCLIILIVFKFPIFPILLYLFLFIAFNLLTLLVLKNKIYLKNVDRKTFKKNVIVFGIVVLFFIIFLIVGIFINMSNSGKLLTNYNTKAEEYNLLCEENDLNVLELNDNINILSDFEVDTSIYSFESKTCDPVEIFDEDVELSNDILKEGYNSLVTRYDALAEYNDEVITMLDKVKIEVNNALENSEKLNIDELNENSREIASTYASGKYSSENDFSSSTVGGLTYKGSWYNSVLNEIRVYYNVTKTRESKYSDTTETVYTIYVEYPVIKYEDIYYKNGDYSTGTAGNKYDKIVSKNMESPETYQKLN